MCSRRRARQRGQLAPRSRSSPRLLCAARVVRRQQRDRAEWPGTRDGGAGADGSAVAGGRDPPGARQLRREPRGLRGAGHLPLHRGTREYAGKTAFGTRLGVRTARDAFRIAAVEGEGDEQMFEDVQGDAPVWDALVVGRKGAAGETEGELGAGARGKMVCRGARSAGGREEAGCPRAILAVLICCEGCSWCCLEGTDGDALEVAAVLGGWSGERGWLNVADAALAGRSGSGGRQWVGGGASPSSHPCASLFLALAPLPALRWAFQLLCQLQPRH